MAKVDRFVIEHDDVVPSMNSAQSGYKAHWAVGHRVKKEWEETLGRRIMLARIPRNMYDYMEVEAVLTFTRALRRDADNYRMMLSKALGDVLATGRWIPDDTPEHFQLTRLTFAKGPKKKTMLTIDARRTLSP